MDYNNPGEAKTPVRGGGLGVKLGLVAASLAVGAIAATAITAGAEPSSSTTPSASASASPAPSGSTSEEGTSRGGHRGGGHGSGPVRGDEKAVTDAQAATLKAAALKAVPGGTVYRVETDGDGAAFEAHMTRADGTEVTVKFDEKLAVTEVQEGMGKGDPKSGDAATPSCTDHRRW